MANLIKYSSPGLQKDLLVSQGRAGSNRHNGWSAHGQVGSWRSGRDYPINVLEASGCNKPSNIPTWIFNATIACCGELWLGSNDTAAVLRQMHETAEQGRMWETAQIALQPLPRHAEEDRLRFDDSLMGAVFAHAILLRVTLLAQREASAYLFGRRSCMGFLVAMAAMRMVAGWLSRAQLIHRACATRQQGVTVVRMVLQGCDVNVTLSSTGRTTSANVPQPPSIQLTQALEEASDVAKLLAGCFRVTGDAGLAECLRSCIISQPLVNIAVRMQARVLGVCLRRAEKATQLALLVPRRWAELTGSRNTAQWFGLVGCNDRKSKGDRVPGCRCGDNPAAATWRRDSRAHASNWREVVPQRSEAEREVRLFSYTWGSVRQHWDALLDAARAIGRQPLWLDVADCNPWDETSAQLAMQGDTIVWHPALDHIAPGDAEEAWIALGLSEWAERGWTLWEAVISSSLSAIVGHRECSLIGNPTLDVLAEIVTLRSTGSRGVAQLRGEVSRWEDGEWGYAVRRLFHAATKREWSKAADLAMLIGMQSREVVGTGCSKLELCLAGWASVHQPRAMPLQTPGCFSCGGDMRGGREGVCAVSFGNVGRMSNSHSTSVAWYGVVKEGLRCCGVWMDVKPCLNTLKQVAKSEYGHIQCVVSSRHAHASDGVWDDNSSHYQLRVSASLRTLYEWTGGRAEFDLQTGMLKRHKRCWRKTSELQPLQEHRCIITGAQWIHPRLTEHWFAEVKVVVALVVRDMLPSIPRGGQGAAPALSLQEAAVARTWHHCGVAVMHTSARSLLLVLEKHSSLAENSVRAMLAEGGTEHILAGYSPNSSIEGSPC